MATYLTGSNKYIPQIQPYQPDLNFYKTVLDTKTAQYEAGYDRVNSIYGTLLNSPLTRQDTSGMRNDFFSKANNEIQRLAGVDLSLEDNQTAAFQVFKPLTTNKLFAKDVNFTKDLYNEYDRSEFFRDCLNEKECGGKYWQGGVDYLQYKAKDFAEADEKTAMGMESPKYVPFVNVVSDAVDFALKSKLEMQTVTSDGRYIYTTTNGVPMETPLHSYFIAKYGNDQKAADMYAVSAYLQRKNYGQSKSAEFGSTQAAEADYIQQVISAADKANREYKKQAEQTKETVGAKKGVVEEYIKNKGVNPEMDKDLIEYYQRLNDDTDAADAADTYYKESLDISSPSSLEGISQTALAARADAILARNLLDSDMATAAHSYATMTQKQDVKADPIYLENLDFSHQMSLESYKNQNAMQKANWDYANDLEKMLWKSRLDTDLPVGKVEKALGFLNEALNSGISAISGATNNDKTASGNSTGDAYDSDDEKKKKTPEQLKYEADLHANALKKKDERENELEFQIHQLRGHSSAQIWKEMGKDKLSSLGMGEEADLLFLDSEERQLAVAKQMFEAYQQGTTLTEKQKIIAGAYSMGWGTDLEGYAATGYQKTGPLKNAYSDAKPAEAAQTNTNTDPNATSSNTPSSTSNIPQGGGQGPVAVPNITQPVDSSATTSQVDSSATTSGNFVAPADSTATASNNVLPTGQDSVPDFRTAIEKYIDQSLNKNEQGAGTGDGSMVRVDPNRKQFMQDNPALAEAGIGSPEEFQAVQEFASKSFADQMWDPNFTSLRRSLKALTDPLQSEAMLKAADDYAKMFSGTGLEKYYDIIRNDNRALLSGKKEQQNSVIGAVIPFGITDMTKAETTASKIDPESTEEFKNIQIPNSTGHSLLDVMRDVGLSRMANKIESRNAITAGFDPDRNDVTHFKNITVKTIIGKYQDKIRTGTANEKKSALASLKKIFPRFAAMNWIGANGEIKSPVANVSLPIEDNYTTAVNEFDKDPLFRDDVDTKNKIVDAASMVDMAVQESDAKLKVDQYNIGQVSNKMLTNEGLMGVGDDLASFMDKYLFKNLGTISSPNSSSNNSPLKAVRTREDFTNDIYNNEKTWAAADVMADAMMGVTVGPGELGAHVMKHPGLLMDDDMHPGLFAVNLQTMAYLEKGQEAFNPGVLKRFNQAANKALGIEGERENFWQFVKNAYSNKPKPLQEGDSGVKYTVEKLNNNGINGKELLKNALMETWVSEGRTSEWTIYDEYAKKNNGQVPRLDFQEIPAVGYDKFMKEYGVAAADLNANLQTYTTKNQIGEAYTGQGGLVALPYGINFNEGLSLAVATGNQDMIGLVSNLNEVLGSDAERTKPFNQRAYVLDMPYNDVVKELDLSDEAIEDWDWDNSAGNVIERIFSGTLESKHKKASTNTNKLMNQMVSDLKNQYFEGDFTRLDMLEGDIKTYPVAVGTRDMTAYQITLNGEYVKAKGFQENNRDKVFTILIPSYKANNTLYKRATTNSWVDLALWANGKATINIPNSGNITITQDNMDNYVMNGQMYLPDSLGNISLQQLGQQVSSKGTVPGWLFADQIRQQLMGNHIDITQIQLNRRANSPLEKNPGAFVKQN
jgi:hypothetical protein